MGWCSGSYLAEEIYSAVREYIPENEKKNIATMIYEIFSNQDADCWENDMSIIQDGKIED